ncbi:hypothetical protein [Streptomyces qinglanensis]|uniref:Uncharacterized protein n=1 Tax=Streptomyces qinglanensis TaxID=943816 RepID=A0A1H9WWE0_9ACTN|nr:hypothetical protein [Streptomyces qinglanensis]SES38252.1 hypothetical protein SAMN05421870_1232 [Streptomyces qinglanensis]
MTKQGGIWTDAGGHEPRPAPPQPEPSQPESPQPQETGSQGDD